MANVPATVTVAAGAAAAGATNKSKKFIDLQPLQPLLESAAKEHNEPGYNNW